MKVLCAYEDIKKGILITERITGKNINLPIINNCSIETTPQGILFSSTDLENAVEVIIPGKIEEDGKVVISAKLLSEFIQNLPPQPITLQSENFNLHVISGQFTSLIHGENPQDFPIIPSLQGNNSEGQEFSVSLLKDGFSGVIIVVSQGNVRSELQGVLLQYNGGEIIFAATDSFRLAEKKINYSHSSQESYIIPIRTIQEFLRIFEHENTVRIITTKNQILFTSPSLRFTSRLIEGMYPNYRPLIPKDLVSKFTIETQKFIQLVRVTSAFSGKSNEVRLHIKKNLLEVATESSEKGKGSSGILIELEGNPCEILVNFKFLLDGLSTIKTKNVIVGINDKNSPLVLKPQQDPTYIYLLMPIRS